MTDERGRTLYHQGVSKPPAPEAPPGAQGQEPYSDPAADRFARGVLDSMPHAVGMIRSMPSLQGSAIPTTMVESDQSPLGDMTRNELRELYTRTRTRAAGSLDAEAVRELDRMMQQLDGQ